MKNFITRAAYARGYVISLCCLLERNIDITLSKYFSKDGKEEEMIQLLFSSDKINLKSKYRLILDILRTKFNKEEFEILFPSIQRKFDFFAEFRNRFAHEAEIISDNLPNEFYDYYDICLISLKI